MLLELKRPADALKEFEASHVREPERFRGYWGAGQAAAPSGDKVRPGVTSRGWWTSPVRGARGRSWRKRARS